MSCATCYLTADHLGSTRMVTDGSSGQVVERHDYLPFGEDLYAGLGPRTTAQGYRNSTATPDLAQRFTGKERDAETATSAMPDGLDYFGARYFSGAMGRFTSPDWSETPKPVPYADLTDPQTLNLYAYVRNNPLNRADVDGHCCEVEIKHAFQIVKTTVGATASKGLGLLGVLGGAATLYIGEMISPHTTVSTGDLPKDANGKPIMTLYDPKTGKSSREDKALEDDAKRDPTKDKEAQADPSGGGKKAKGGRPPTTPTDAGDAVDKLDNINAEQGNFRKTGNPDKIQSTDKSKQNAETQVKKQYVDK
jgi:RHS repeat-associated protein